MPKNPMHIAYVFCDEHSKRGYFKKKDAERAIRKWHKGEHLDVYPCTRGTGLWHIGHLPIKVRAGVVARGVITGRQP